MGGCWREAQRGREEKGPNTKTRRGGGAVCAFRMMRGDTVKHGNLQGTLNHFVFLFLSRLADFSGSVMVFLLLLLLIQSSYSV